MADEATFTKPTTVLDMERFQAEEEARASGKKPGPDDGTDGRDFRVEGNDTDAYVGVNPEYMTYANETEAPAAAEEGVEKALEEQHKERLKDIEASTAGAGIHGRRPLLREADPVEAVANRNAGVAPTPQPTTERAPAETPKTKAASPAKD